LLLHFLAPFGTHEAQHKWCIARFSRQLVKNIGVFEFVALQAPPFETQNNKNTFMFHVLYFLNVERGCGGVFCHFCRNLL